MVTFSAPIPLLLRLRSTPTRAGPLSLERFTC